MPPKIDRDLIGVKFGKWTVIEAVPREYGKPKKWICQCDCGHVREVLEAGLIRGDSASCGKHERPGRRIHGRLVKEIPEYSTWRAMRSRCNNPNAPEYYAYGGRGIRVCEEWNVSFQAFIRDMGPRPSFGYSLDRIDKSGNYEPTNCRWATRTEQMANRRPSSEWERAGPYVKVGKAKQPLNLVGSQFGRWTVIECAGRDKYTLQVWKCRCECGVEKIIQGRVLLRGESKSCGHHPRLSRRIIAEITTTDTPEYGVWHAMIQRCSGADPQSVRNYKGRGITVCERWKSSFKNFLDDMGARPGPNYSLDRINNDGNYEPGNCRWATRKVQNRNMRTTVFLEINGVRKPRAEWAELLGISSSGLQWRLKNGWPAEKAVSQPSSSR